MFEDSLDFGEMDLFFGEVSLSSKSLPIKIKKGIWIYLAQLACSRPCEQSHKFGALFFFAKFRVHFAKIEGIFKHRTEPPKKRTAGRDRVDIAKKKRISIKALPQPPRPHLSQ